MGFVMDSRNISCYAQSGTTGLFTHADFWTVWLSAIPMVTLFIVTLTANGAIILMFALKSKLRKCRNTYIVSLAVADFLIGLTMPFSILETLGEEWKFSDAACTAFLTIRYSLYYVTILSIVLITIDRWWSVNFPFSYRIRRSKKMALSLAAIIWFLSVLIHIPSIVGWNFLHVPIMKHHRYCRVPYEYNTGFTVSAAVIEFFIPLVLLISLNLGLYIKLVKRRNSKKIRRSLSQSDSHCVYGRKSSTDSDNTNNSDELAELMHNLSSRSDVKKAQSFVSQYRRFTSERTGSTQFSTKLAIPRHSSVRRLSMEYAALLAHIPRKCSAARKCSRASISSKAKNQDDIVRDFLIRQDNKALMSLALLVAMFVVCWTPITFCDILYSLCPTRIPLWIVQLSYWMLALNSAVNPFLYGVGNSDFRRVAKSWMFCCKKNNFRVFEAIMYNHLIQPSDLIALKELEITRSGSTCKDPVQFV